VIASGAARIAADTGSLPAGTGILWCIRPDHIAIGKAADGPSYPAMVDDVADIGSLTTLTVRLPDGPDLRVRAAGPGGLEPGDPCAITLDPAWITLWPATAAARAQ
jgi:hypothetical protein